MPRNTYFFENIVFTKQSDRSIIGGGKRKELTIIKRVKSTQEFEET